MQKNNKPLHTLILELASVYANTTIIGILLAYVSKRTLEKGNIHWVWLIILITPILLFMRLFANAIIETYIKPIHAEMQPEPRAWFISICLVLLLLICFGAPPLYTFIN